jgi:hypothetical protein
MNAINGNLHEWCNRVFMLGLISTLIAISIHIKQYRKLTFEVFVFALTGICLTFIAWATGAAKAQDIFVAIGLSAIVCLPVLWHFDPNNERLSRLGDREDIPMEVIYSRFFTGTQFPKDLVVELWNEVASCLRVPPGKLRPSDRFDKELAVHGVWLRLDEDAQAVNLAAQYRLNRIGAKNDLTAVPTLRDYVELFCRLETSNKGSR